MKNIALYIITVIVWGSTWIGIKYQLGSVDPMVSVMYRSGLASILLLIYCYIKKVNLKFSLKEHLFMALLGVFLFSIHYWLVYIAEIHLTSGIVAVIYSSVVFMNIMNGYLFLGTAIERKTIIGAIIGFIGVFMIFMPEIQSVDFSNKAFFSVLLTFISVLIYSFGNITSARNTKNNIPILQANAFGMGYGTLLLLLLTLFLGKEISFDISVSYIGSLFYLSVFGSVIAYGTYLTLIGIIGADKAAYSIMLVPVVALIISSFFEDYSWSFFAVIGIVFVVGGNLLVLNKSKK